MNEVKINSMEDFIANKDLLPKFIWDKIDKSITELYTRQVREVASACCVYKFKYAEKIINNTIQLINQIEQEEEDEADQARYDQQENSSYLEEHEGEFNGD